MTTSIGRITRLAVGVIAAALGIVLLIVDAPAASAGGGMTVHLKQSGVRRMLRLHRRLLCYY